MDKKIVILVIFMILSISYVYAPENTATCPANIDVFDYDLIVGKIARVKAIANKQGKIEIFSTGLTGTLSRGLVKLKTCDNDIVCEYTLPLPIPDTLSLSGSIAQYYAELTTPTEFVHSVTKTARIGDQGYTNNYCKDESSIVIGGGANTPGARCTYAQPGQCNPGYCSRSYSGTGDVGCFYPNNCVANDPLRTLVPLCSGVTPIETPRETTIPPTRRTATAAREGLSLTTYFNKGSGYQANPAPYSTGEVLTWDYEVRNIGEAFSTSICFFLEYPNHNQKDLTQIIEGKSNIRLSNIIIDNTAQLFDSKSKGNIFTFTFPPSQTDYLPFGQYELIVELREPNSRCSNPDGSIIPASHIEKQINYFNYAGQLRTQSLPSLPCPAVGTTPQAAGCQRIAVSNAIIKTVPGITYTCPNPSENCFECSSGQVYDAGRYSCIITQPTTQPTTPIITVPTTPPPESQLGNGCIPLQDNLPRSTKLKVVIVGNNYGTENQQLFLTDANRIKEQLLSFEPFREYTNRINFYAVNSQIDLGCGLVQGDICLPSRIITFISSECPYDQIILVHKSNIYFGGGRPSDSLAIVTNYLSQINPAGVAHEFGHSFGGLADEPLAIGSGRLQVEYPNCDDNPECTKWQDLIGTPANRGCLDRQTCPLVGCFPGCNFISEGAWRPIEGNTIMQTANGDFGPVNERHLRRLLEHYR